MSPFTRLFPNVVARLQQTQPMLKAALTAGGAGIATFSLWTLFAHEVVTYGVRWTLTRSLE